MIFIWKSNDWYDRTKHPHYEVNRRLLKLNWTRLVSWLFLNVAAPIKRSIRYPFVRFSRWILHDELEVSSNVQNAMKRTIDDLYKKVHDTS